MIESGRTVGPYEAALSPLSTNTEEINSLATWHYERHSFDEACCIKYFLINSYDFLFTWLSRIGEAAAESTVRT